MGGWVNLDMAYSTLSSIRTQDYITVGEEEKHLNHLRNLGTGPNNDIRILNAQAHFLEVFDKLFSIKQDRSPIMDPNKLDFIVALVWGDIVQRKAIRYIDFFAYHKINQNNWPGNPEVSTWSTGDGKILRKKRTLLSEPNLCEDGMIINGMIEAPSRRMSRDIIDHAYHPPEIEGLDSPLVERMITLLY